MVVTKAKIVKLGTGAKLSWDGTFKAIDIKVGGLEFLEKAEPSWNRSSHEIVVDAEINCRNKQESVDGLALNESKQKQNKSSDERT